MSSSTARWASFTACSMPTGPKLPCPTTTGLRSPSRIAPPTFSGSRSSRSLPSLPRISRPPRLDIDPRPHALADLARHHLHRALEHLQRHVAGEAVGHDHVGAGVRKVEALQVPHEVEPALGDALVRGEHAGRALARLLAHRQEAHGGPLDPDHRLHEARAHVRELDEVLGAHLHARAGIEQEHGPAGDRHQDRQRRAVDALDALDRQGRGGQRRAGAAGGHERVCPAVAHRGGSLDDRGVALRADRGHRLLARLDGLGRVHDLGARAGGPGDLSRRAEQQYGEPGAGDPFGDCARPLVGAVRVDRDHSSSESTPGCCTTTSRPA